MKVIISSTGSGMDSEVDEKFGRCPFFILAEIEDKKIKKWEGIENTSEKQMTSAGTTAAQLVADMGTDVIITGNMGPRAFDVFRQLDIEVYEGKGSIRKALKDFTEGRLKRMENAKCPKSA